MERNLSPKECSPQFALTLPNGYVAGLSSATTKGLHRPAVAPPVPSPSTTTIIGSRSRPPCITEHVSCAKIVSSRLLVSSSTLACFTLLAPRTSSSIIASSSSSDSRYFAIAIAVGTRICPTSKINDRAFMVWCVHNVVFRG
ncbi:hypothetical protein KIN20_023616 [Parelaphostrongylus tenuis]|uniref:Uncharacterized protein n=1 Tax=Parelaphostrongylus tenuis TaxID=148309 RepID=A0AAD5QXF6_PARTN|nr:hypothetical protein KIN20_023616 [Parelaphostrongylus tenuis]